MIRYVLAAICLIAGPLAAMAFHYAPLSTDITFKTPVSEYKMTGDVFSYKTPLHEIAQSDLIAAVTSGLERADIHLSPGPDDSAYPYIITAQGNTPPGRVEKGAFHLSGKIISQIDGIYNLSYNLETIGLPKGIAAQLSGPEDHRVKVIWHVRSDGQPRLAGLEIDGKYEAYQFNFKSVLLGLIQ